VDKGCDLSELSLDELLTFSDAITEDIFSVLTLDGSVASRDHVGGTAPKQVLQAVVRAKQRLNSQ
jgi:argininosuccinate lyase